MKLLRVLALLAPVALTVPFSAHAAMSDTNKAKFITECTAKAGESLKADAAKAHCECGAQQVNKNFSDKEIAELNSTNSPPSTALTEKLQKVVAEHCVQTKK